MPESKIKEMIQPLLYECYWWCDFNNDYWLRLGWLGYGRHVSRKD